MAEKELKARSRSVQKMTKDGLVEVDLAEKTTKRISDRGEEVRLMRNRSPDSDKGANFNENQQGGTKGSRLAKYRGDTDKAKSAGTNKPKRKQRLHFKDEAENSGTGAGEEPHDKLSRGSASAGERSEASSERTKTGYDQVKRKKAQEKRYYYEKEEPSGRKPKLFFDKDESTEGVEGAGTDDAGMNDRKVSDAGTLTEESAQMMQTAGKDMQDEPSGRKVKAHRRRYYYKESGKKTAGRRRNYHVARRGSRKLVTVRQITGKLRYKAEEDSDDNAAVRAAAGTQDVAEKILVSGSGKRAGKITDKSIREQKVMDSEVRKEGLRSRFLQKQQIKRDYAKAKRMEETGTAAAGTIDYIKKIGGKVTDFFKENRKVFLGIGAFFLVVMLLATAVSSCGATFGQNIITYAGTSYLSDDQEIFAAELYYTQMEAELQEEIDRMRRDNAGHEEYRYNIAPIQHDPFILISYLSAKYEVFKFDQVKGELEQLFAKQYHLETEAVNETVRETVTVRVGESLGPVVTSGYCNCAACCGSYAGGPTASGVMPTAEHTIAVDSRDPLVPMGTRVIMNGTEYVVEDTGPLNRYGVNFDVYYDDHDVAEAHGHQTWDAYLADDNGTEVEVTRVRQVDAFNVTLANNGLKALCEQRLTDEQKSYFDDYNEVRGNLQMFGKPVDFKWFNRVTAYYGYRVDPVSGNVENHNGIDIFTFSGTEVLSGLDGTVSEAGWNDSYGNYVFLTDSHGYEVRYANLASVTVSAGSPVAIGDVIGTAGSDYFMDSHLHLELLYHGERMNPVFYFEAGEAAYPDIPVNSSGAVGALLSEALSHLGTPYVWGGYDPSGFDCSGFVSWCLVHSGARNTGRLTAQELYDICTPISEAEAMPGDLIFFTGTYDSEGPVSHIGIYLGNGQMVHSGHPNQVASIYTPYWISHFYGFGRW